MKRAILIGIFVALVIAGVTNAGSIITFASGTLRSADLNTNFEHIHNNMVGGHGARLVNADVSSSAAISHSKLATPALLPKLWAQVGSDCTASPCTVESSGGSITSVTRTGSGAYSFNFPARANDVYAVVITALDTAADRFCIARSRSTTAVTFVCYDAGAVATDTGFSIMLLDNDN